MRAKDKCMENCRGKKRRWRRRGERERQDETMTKRYWKRWENRRLVDVEEEGNNRWRAGREKKEEQWEGRRGRGGGENDKRK